MGREVHDIRLRTAGAPRRPPSFYLAAAQSLIALTAASLAVRVLPFRRAIRLGSLRLVHPARGQANELVSRSVALTRRWSDLVPWRSVCIHEGLAVQWLLRRKGIDAKLHYGVRYSSTRELEAHVWVAVAEQIIVDGDVAADYACVAVFPDDA